MASFKYVTKTIFMNNKQERFFIVLQKKDTCSNDMLWKFAAEVLSEVGFKVK